MELGVFNEVVTLDSPSASFLGGDPFPIHAVGPAKGPWSYGAMLVPWLIENLQRFEVVIIHGLWQYHGFAVRRALTLLEKKRPSVGVPRVYVMPHGMLDPYFQRDSSRRLKAIRNELYWKFVESKNVNQASGVLFTCEEELRLARETFRNYSPKEELNIGYGVAEPPSSSAIQKDSFLAACPDLGGRPYLLFLSRIHAKKGVDILIRSYAELVKSHLSERSAFAGDPSQGAGYLPSLVIAGPLDSVYASEMQKLAVELLSDSGQGAADPRIHFVGMLQGDVKWGAFHGCDAFVLPSHQENFGIAVVEALACGKPVIISNKVNIWREIDRSGAGIVADDSVVGTKDALTRWIGLTGLEKETMRGNAQICFSDHYRMKNVAKMMADSLCVPIKKNS